MNDIVHGELSWRLSNDSVTLWITHLGGHVGPVEFQLEGRTVSPYALAPWASDEAPDSLPNLLSVLRGDFFCFPFGPQESGPPHGVSANEPWRLVDGNGERISLSMGDPDSGGKLDKIVFTRAGETAVYSEHRISGVSGRFSYGNHPILNCSGLDEGHARVSVSPFRWASVYPGMFSDPANQEFGALEPGGRFSDLRAVPLADGGTTDLTRYPARKGCEDLVMMVSEPTTIEQPFAWSAVVLDGYVWFSLKNPADFPATLFWISNGGRHAAPWNGSHLGRIGIEEVCSHFSDSVDVSRGDRLAEDSIPTSREFVADQTVSLRILQAVAAVDEDFGRVISIRPNGPGSVLITGETGKPVESTIDWNFVL